jgi:hypothetical protein
MEAHKQIFPSCVYNLVKIVRRQSRAKQYKKYHRRKVHQLSITRKAIQWYSFRVKCGKNYLCTVHVQAWNKLSKSKPKCQACLVLDTIPEIRLLASSCSPNYSNITKCLCGSDKISWLNKNIITGYANGSEQWNSHIMYQAFSYVAIIWRARGSQEHYHRIC